MRPGILGVPLGLLERRPGAGLVAGGQLPAERLEVARHQLERIFGLQRLPAGERNERNSSDSGEQHGPPESLCCLASWHPKTLGAQSHRLTTKPPNARLGSKLRVPRYLIFTSHWPSLRTLAKRALMVLSPPPIFSTLTVLA